MAERENSGALFKNKTKTGNQPDYSGPATVDGVEYRMAGWISQGEGGKFLSVAFTVKDEQAAQAPANDDDDDIPF